MLQYLKENRFIKHLLFWMLFILAGTLTDLSKFDKYCFFELIAFHINDAIFGAILAYILVYIVLKPSFLQKGYLLFGITFLVVVYFLSALCRLSTVYVMEPLVRKPPFVQESAYEIFTDLPVLAFKYGPAILTAAFVFYIAKFFSDYRQESEKRLVLSKEKTEAELKLLRAQLNPHFLFNTLNNIYSLSIIGSSKTPEAISKLSDILDYALYKGNKELVSISSEVKAVEDYIELEKLRYDERLVLTFTKDISNDNLVPPLIVLSLVENAFKHGAGEDSNSPEINIEIICDLHKTDVIVSNSISNQHSQNDKDAIGLENIKKQLELLFPNKHSLTIIKQNNVFKVHLILEK